MQRFSLSRAIAFIGLWTLLISGTATASWLGWRYFASRQLGDATSHCITAIGQRCRVGEPIPTLFFAETLGLAVDVPVNLYNFDLERATASLLSYPAIKEAVLHRMPPNTLWVEYSVRTPVALLADFTNIAVDSEGVPFPLAPILTPKVLPHIFLGINQEDVLPFYTNALSQESSLLLQRLHLGLDILKECRGVSSEEGCRRLAWVDVALAQAESWGRRQIVLGFDSSNGCPTNRHLLRLLPPKASIKEALQFYLLLLPCLGEKSRNLSSPNLISIDMRIPSLALISLVDSGMMQQHPSVGSKIQSLSSRAV